MTITWSEEAVRALGVRTDVETAGSILGLSRTQSYEAVRTGRFPVPAFRIGRRIVVPVAPILRVLGLEVQPSGASEATAAEGQPAKLLALT
jgi:hypothetical protein